MVSSNFDDYEVLNILGDLNSICYKVRNRLTLQLFIWIAVGYKDEDEKQNLLVNIKEHKRMDSSNILKICACIPHGTANLLYVMTEYCDLGNLSGIIFKCLHDNEYLHEDFLWKIIYELCCTLKTSENLLRLSTNTVFITDDHKIKVLSNVKYNLKQTIDGRKNIKNLSSIIVELCTLKFQDYTTIENAKQIIQNFPTCYSPALKEIVRFVLTDTNSKSIVDAILCHPTVLIKSNRSKIENIYVKRRVLSDNESINDTNQDNHDNTQIEILYRSKLENLKNREAALRNKEEKLTLKIKELEKREKKIGILERIANEKVYQAELYLKRCKDQISTKIGICYENCDSTYPSECGDSSMIVNTSKKLVYENIKKPHNFIRTMSERRVRFKGHSPLKDLHSKMNIRDQKLVNSRLTIVSDSGTATTTSDKCITDTNEENVITKKIKSRKRLDLFSAFPIRRRKPLLEDNGRVIYEDFENKLENVQYKPWTEESKQHAFDLLRIMTKDKSSEPIKHTCL